VHKLEQILQIEHQLVTPMFRPIRLILSASTPDPNNHKIEGEYNLNCFMPRDSRWEGIHTRYGEPSGCCGAGTRSWTLWSAKCQRSVLYFL